MTNKKKMTIVSAAASTAVLATIIVGAAATALVGCGRVENAESTGNAWSHHGRGCCTKVVEIEGHKYIIMDGYKCGGIIHAASCQCMNK